MLKMIGYWIRFFDDCEYIAPQELVTTYAEDVKSQIIAYLDGGTLFEAYCGRSTCRYPRCKHADRVHGLGSGEFTDSVWVWPEGLSHYVLEHDVLLPDEFVSHALTTPITPRSREYVLRSGDVPKVDLGFWMEWCRRSGSGVVRNRIEARRNEAAGAIAQAEMRARADFGCKCVEMEQQFGLDSGQCSWKECQKHTLRGKAFCAWHLEQRSLDFDLALAKRLTEDKYLTACLNLA